MLHGDSSQANASIPQARLLSRLTGATASLVLVGVLLQIRFHTHFYLMLGIATVLVLGSIVLAHRLMNKAIQDFVNGVHADTMSLLEKAEASQRLLAILSTAVEGSMEAVVSVDTSDNVTYINPAAESLIGWKRWDAVHRPLNSVVILRHETTLKTVESPVQKVWQDRLRHELSTLTVVESQTGVHTPVDGTSLPVLKKMLSQVQYCSCATLPSGVRRESPSAL